MDSLQVLVVDDDPGMRSGVARALKNYAVVSADTDDEVGFHVLDASSGEEALQKCASDEIDILLLDYKLPGISGLDVLNQVVADSPDRLVVFMTAYASIETAVRATKQGAYDFLPKPFSPDELRNAVRKAARQVIAVRQAKKLAEEKRQVRFQFISVLSHELKAPLAAIEGYLNILRDRSIGDQPETYELLIQRSIRRIEYMRKMIFDLLDLTRIESGQKLRQFQSVDICETVGHAIETVRPEATERNVQIYMDSEAPLEFYCDPEEIEIILNNLLSNAIKYNRERGRIDVRCKKDERGELTIAVSDTGIGLTKEESAKLFQDFVRIRNEKTSEILGSGLGLSTVKKLARLYGGDVDVSSTPDEGSTFTVRLMPSAEGRNEPQ